MTIWRSTTNCRRRNYLTIKKVFRVKICMLHKKSPT